MKKTIIVCSLVSLFNLNFTHAGTWTTLNVPGAESSTHINGISENCIFGSYGSLSSSHGFIYNGMTWETVDVPGADVAEIRGLSGNIIVGREGNRTSGYKRSFFIYDGTSLISLNHPLVFTISIEGNIVAGDNGFYDLTTSTWTPLNYPNAGKITIYGINGNILVGSYSDRSSDPKSYPYQHGFIYDLNIQTWTTLDMPGADSTRIFDIDHDNIIGSFSVSGHNYGFLYDGTNWITDLPGLPTGINGDKIVGTYQSYDEGEDGVTHLSYHGYIYTIPEPASIFLTMVSLGIFRFYNRKS